jgi:cytochrome c oxidase subunit 3
VANSPAALEHSEVPGAEMHQHQFDDPLQQYVSSTLGMWSFLLTEVMFFGGMFGAYAIYRAKYPDAFASTSHYMNIPLGGANTAVLICSSLTMALAVRAAQMGRKQALIGFLIATLVLGSVFLGIKAVEYHEKYVDHHIPGPTFSYPEKPELEHTVQILFFLYFAMTGMHAVHMVVGAGLLTALIIMAARNRFSVNYYTPVEMIGLYWHFVDIVWIFLFPLLYLIGRHS